MIETGTRLNATAAIKAARELAAGFSERAGYYDRTAEFPFENFERLHKTGLMNLTVPEEFGGSGLGIEAAARVTSTIAEGEPSTALVLVMHYIYHGFPAVTGTWNPKARAAMADGSRSRKVRPSAMPNSTGFPRFPSSDCAS